MATETLRPNAAGDETNIPSVVPSGAEHWSTVDEETSDEDTSYVNPGFSTNDWYRDLYNLPAHTGSGDINSVTVYARARAGTAPTQTNLKIACKTNGVAYEGSELTIPASYANYSQQWATNPNTGGAWTWGEIDALQIGISMRRSTSSYGTRCTQVWVEIDYTPPTPKTSSDVGSGIEALVARLLATFDTGTDIEVGELLEALFASELGLGSDSLTAKIEIPAKGGGMKLWT